MDESGKQLQKVINQFKPDFQTSSPPSSGDV
jgi:hypothetical protein